MALDVTSLNHRRAVNRWERVSVGDFWERITWSYPDKEAIVGRPGAFAYPATNGSPTGRPTSSPTGWPTRCWLRRRAGDRVLFFCDNSTEAYLTKIAVAKAGLVSAPNNPWLARDVIRQPDPRTEPKISFVDDVLWRRCREGLRRDAGLMPRVTIPVGGEVLAVSVLLPAVRGRPAHHRA